MKILVVDDEPLIRELLGEFLEEEGHEVQEAENGLKAWELLSEKENGIKAVLADIKMPVMGGRELLQRIRENNMTLPVVLLSGQINVTNEDALNVGATHILHKPLEFADILSILEEIEFQSNGSK